VIVTSAGGPLFARGLVLSSAPAVVDGKVAANIRSGSTTLVVCCFCLILYFMDVIKLNFLRILNLTKRTQNGGNGVVRRRATRDLS
jgi:hypothetical protein